jgi:hypothetical protein
VAIVVNVSSYAESSSCILKVFWLNSRTRRCSRDSDHVRAFVVWLDFSSQIMEV